LDRIPTGIKGLDELLGGGFPSGKCILVVGSPGSGKTTLVVQFLRGGISRDERGLYVTLEERPEEVKQNLAGFGWNLDGLEREGKLLFVDATPLRRVSGLRCAAVNETGVVTVPELTLHSLVRTVGKVVEEENIQRIAVDPITSLLLRYGDERKMRRAMLLLFDALMNTDATTLVTSELRTSALDREFKTEEFVSQGVILLHTLVHDGNVVKAIQIEKMRGIQHDTQLRPYQIGIEGIEVFPKDKVF